MQVSVRIAPEHQPFDGFKSNLLISITEFITRINSTLNLKAPYCDIYENKVLKILDMKILFEKGL